MTSAEFLALYPQFDAATDAQINAWLALSAKMLPEDRWADLLDHGTGLFVAHYLTVGAKAATSGAVQMPVSSKSVDKVSVSYDTTAALIEGGGHWNSTAYGVQFIQLARMVGAGGAQL